MARQSKDNQSRPSLAKSPTGIRGFDQITTGGVPTGRPTLVCGSAGCGKTLFAMEFLVRGATEFKEPGVFVAFEETAPELTANVASLGFHLDDLIAGKLIAVDHVRVERSEIEETGDYDLEGLFLRLGHQIDAIGAKRVVLDTIESLFSGFTNMAVLRAELRRLFRWLKDRGVTALITGERGETSLTRQGLEEYVSDCVILLDHRVTEQISTRRLRIVKYRGTSHGTNEYPFIIDEAGISVLPATPMGLSHRPSKERVSSGVQDLDVMLGGEGYYRGTTVLVSGTAGTGKTSLAAHFSHAACRRGERALYSLFEESPNQVIRNMQSIGLDLEPWVSKGLLRFQAARPALQGLEQHLVSFHRCVEEFQPSAVIIDPISNLLAIGSELEVNAMLVRLIDFLKLKNVTTILTSLTSGGSPLENTNTSISSLVDTWLLLRDVENNGERNHALYVLKSRGMAHSNQVREFFITDQGIRLIGPYVGPSGVLFGSARRVLEAREKAAELIRGQDIEQKKRELDRRRRAVEAEIEALRRRSELEEEDLKLAISQAADREEVLKVDLAEIARVRKVQSSKQTGTGRKGGRS